MQTSGRAARSQNPPGLLEGRNRIWQALLDAGAVVRGRTHMDELAYSLNGENMHYGTPVRDLLQEPNHLHKPITNAWVGV